MLAWRVGFKSTVVREKQVNRQHVTQGFLRTRDPMAPSRNAARQRRLFRLACRLRVTERDSDPFDLRASAIDPDEDAARWHAEPHMRYPARTV